MFGVPHTPHPHDWLPRPRSVPKVTIGASVPVSEAQRLRAIAEARGISLTKLLAEALAKAYPVDTPPPGK